MILQNEKKNKTRMLSNAFRLIFKHIFQILLGQSIFIAIYVLMVTPLVHYSLDMARSLSGFSYITLNNFLRFVINPLTLLTLLILALLLGLFLLFETAFFITFFSSIENGDAPKIFAVFFLALKRVVLTIIHRNFKLIPVIWLTLFFYNIPLVIFLIRNVGVFRYASRNLNQYPFILPIILVFLALLFWLLFRRPFVLQYCLIEGKSYRQACGLSGKMNRKRAVRAFFYIITWNTLVGLFVYLIRIAVMVVAALLVIVFADKEFAIVTFISINERISNYLSVGFFSVGMLANAALFTHMFYQYKKEENEYFYFDNSVETVFLKLRSYKKIIIVVAVAFTFINIYMSYNIIRNDASFIYVDFAMIKITSHRGFSNDVPENTIPAIEKAIEEQADYVEADVRQTKDGELILLHDENLRRTTGLNKYVWNVDYVQVAALDAGKWMDAAYAGTRIPTLREALELCKGRINMNLDLKYDNHTAGLEEGVVGLIEEYEMESQCVISSTNADLLKNVRALNDKIRTGYITYRIEPDRYEDENIDFFSMNSHFVYENLLQKVHDHGKEIHVWTVNTRNDLTRMKNLGVDNIITDNPSYAKEVLNQDNSNRLIITLFKMMLTY